MLLADIAQVIRSENAGPDRVTLDMTFATDADYQRVAHSSALGPNRIAALYRVAPEAVTVIHYPVGRAMKIVLARRTKVDDPGGVDVYGTRQHAPLSAVEID